MNNKSFNNFSTRQDYIYGYKQSKNKLLFLNSSNKQTLETTDRTVTEDRRHIVF